MDIIVRQLSKSFLAGHIVQFIGIIENIPGEYWSESHFLSELPGKFLYSCYAAEAKGDISGYIIASQPEKGHLHIHKFMVAEPLRGKRIGEKMLEFFEKNALENNQNKITLKVGENNEGAIRFYKRLGFEVEGRSIDSVTSDGLLKMKKSI